ncbi:MAG: DnaJ domain-containing protein, partial [Rhodospirillales bacterium]|nr:DnaJ domain-containing protein [Rhodospirillales bacterium]
LGLLVLVVFLSRWFATANPSNLARWVKWSFIAAGAAATIFLGVTGKTHLAFLPLALTGLPWFIGRMAAGRMNPNPSAGQRSDVETPYLRMTLDHDSGEMEGSVLQGRHAGRRLDDLTEPELLDLFGECSLRDDEGRRLLEAYLDRTLGPDWRERAEAGAERAHSTADGAGQGWGRKRQSASAGRTPMTREEAYEILGLSPGAGTEEIKEAHRTLMRKLHPDHGGSNYLAAKINQAKELLLGG